MRLPEELPDSISEVRGNQQTPPWKPGGGGAEAAVGRRDAERATCVRIMPVAMTTVVKMSVQVTQLCVFLQVS